MAKVYQNKKKKDKNCLTGNCPTLLEPDTSVVKLSEGSGGRDMQLLIDGFADVLSYRGNWKNTDDDSATLKLGDKTLVFTTDSYVVTPIFFPGGNIGKIAFCGTVNDLSVMGAKPLGLSLGIVVEEGFPKLELSQIMETIGGLSKKHGIPVATGDTKVMEHGAIDKIVINTSGIGIAKTVLDTKLKNRDKIIVSGGIGEHGTALLAKRFELETDLPTDSKPLWDEMRAIGGKIKRARDITRGGLASTLNELAEKDSVRFLINEEKVPMKDEVRALTQVLGVEVYNLACEGRFVCFASPKNSLIVLNKLKKFNPLARIIGEVEIGKDVIVQTRFGQKILSMPLGEIVPRIC